MTTQQPDDDDPGATTRASRVPGTLERTAAAAAGSATSPFPLLAPISALGGGTAADPLPRPGDSIVTPHRCDAPSCRARTTIFIATSDGARVVHFCALHFEWAASEAQVQGWWK